MNIARQELIFDIRKLLMVFLTNTHYKKYLNGYIFFLALGDRGRSSKDTFIFSDNSRFYKIITISKGYLKPRDFKKQIRKSLSAAPILPSGSIHGVWALVPFPSPREQLLYTSVPGGAAELCSDH